MWTLKDNVTILIRKEGIRINRDALEKNPDLALLVMNNEDYKKKWGHNFVEVPDSLKKSKQSATVRPDEIIIPVDIKKKQQVESQSETSPESASTSKEAQTGGQSLIQNAPKPESQSGVSRQSKQGTGNQSSQKRK